MSPYDEWVSIENARLALTFVLDGHPERVETRRLLDELTKDSKRIRKTFRKGSKA